MNALLTALKVRFGVEGIGGAEALPQTIRTSVTAYHPTRATLADLTDRVLRYFLTPTAVDALATASLLITVQTPVAAIIQEHWSAVAEEFGFTHPAKQFDMVIHHANCPDGLAAAWCFWRHNRDIELVPLKHGQLPPSVAGKRVIVLDFSFPRALTEQFHAAAAEFIVQDHHESAQTNLVGLPYCEFDMTRAGCEMAWDYAEGLAPRPWWLTAIADHDVWRLNYDSEGVCCALYKRRLMTLEGLQSIHDQPTLREELLVEGRKLFAELMEQVEPYVKYSVLARFKDTELRVRVAQNCPPHLRSWVGHKMCKVGDCDFAAIAQYCFEKDEWWVSLRGEGKVNLAVLTAGINGGGGHPNAAGCTLYGQRGENMWAYFKPLPPA